MDQQLQLHSGTYLANREKRGLFLISEAWVVLFCTMETLVSVPAEEAVKDEVV